MARANVTPAPAGKGNSLMDRIASSVFIAQSAAHRAVQKHSQSEGWMPSFSHWH